MTRYILALISCVVLSSTVFAQDEPLPESVATPYLAYEQAMQAQDYPAAEAAAEETWRAAERARIDRELIGILASNYGDLALALGHYEDAHEAWRQSARISDRLRSAPEERAQRWYMASISALNAGDINDARACSTRSVRAIRSEDAAVSSTLAGNANYLLAQTSAQMGRFGQMGDAARDALEAFQLEDRPFDKVHANAYYLSGMDYYFWGDIADSIPHFQMANGIYLTLGEDSESDALSAGYWVELALDNLDDDERAEVEVTLATLAFPPVDATGSEEDESASEEFVEDEHNYDARPIRRVEPDYPSNILYAGIEGIVMAHFSVTPEGTLEDLEVIASAPPGLFNETVENAMSRWVYEPKHVDGVPVRRDGVSVQFLFSICDGTAAACRREAREREREEADE